MKQLLATVALAVCLLAPQAQAQASAKAYAPENIGQLNQQDQARVIRQEYMDQTGGRRIPDDQLQFYMAQIQSGWRFSQVKSDIATSLRGDGNGNGQHNGNGGNWGGNAAAIRCESVNNRLRECPTNFRNRAVLRRELSNADCTEGRSWGQRRGTVWVNWGCRAEFVESEANWSGGNDGGNYSVTCSSPSESYTTCAWQSRYGRPVLIEKLSRAECIEGRSWGYRGNSIWVDRGCRGRFGSNR